MRIEECHYILPDGKDILIRSAGPDDAMLVKKHREITSMETHFMAREPEDGQMNEERIKSALSDMEKSERDFAVTAFFNGEVIGDLSVTSVRLLLKYRHRAYLGMSIQQEYAGMGLGSFMMKTALQQAIRNGFEQIELGVFSDNEIARHLYQKNGFKEYGIHPRAFKLKDGTYRDEIIMVNILND